jgi:hypothetical protein
VGEWWESKWWDTWGAPVTAIATGFAYGVGYASVSYFASSLNVSVGDLGLDLRDYLLLTGLTGVAWMLLVGAVASLIWMGEQDWCKDPKTTTARWQKAGVIVGAIVAVVLVVLFIFQTVVSSDFHFGWGAVAFFGVVYPLFFGGIYGSVKLLTGSSGNRRFGWTILVLVVLLVTPSTTLAGAGNWASSLLEDAEFGEDPGQGPFPLRLVLQPEVGTATIETDAATDADTDEACVLRVGERVFLGAAAVVVRDVTSFMSSSLAMEPECPPLALVPWTPEFGAETGS